ncbi:PREDICTED: uncharacterized protein LOC108609682 [Drosophila arizonae]|uniref:Uncharacterized protein LOC108609682 n=1 Tax=Drosophila arizonae TaxID=7263 RepID=A0ABM1NPK7_DROAR|nr:PREDICTED: uncharacterized protein LOC108609682 [Drosophila arizonae]
MFVYFCFFLLIGAVSTEKCKFQIIFDSVSCKKYAPELVEDMNCWKVHLNNRSSLSGNLILKVNTSQIYVTSKMDFWKTDNTKVRLYNLRGDACAFLSNIQKNRFVNTLVRTIKEYSNGIFRCPFNAGFNYTLNRWYINEKDLPSYVPEGTFQTTTEYKIEKKKAFRILVRGRVEY